MQETQEMHVRSLGREDARGGGGWQPTPVFLPEKFHRGAQWATVHGITKSRTQLSTHAHTHTHIELTLLAMRQ